MQKLRTILSPTDEAYIDLNDLIIELMIEEDKHACDSTKQFIRQLVLKLEALRDHKTKH